MTNQMKEIANAIYELTVNPTATPSNWENLAKDIQVAILNKNEKTLSEYFKQPARYMATVIGPEPDEITPAVNSDKQQCMGN